MQISNSCARKAAKWSKNQLLFLLNYDFFNMFLMYKTLNQTKQDKCRKFLLEIARGWIMEQGDTADSSNDDNNSVPSGKRSAPRGGLHWTHQEDSWEILVGTSQGKWCVQDRGKLISCRAM